MDPVKWAQTSSGNDPNAVHLSEDSWDIGGDWGIAFRNSKWELWPNPNGMGMAAKTINICINNSPWWQAMCKYTLTYTKWIVKT